MIFVNNPGDWGHVFPPFDHAEWHGWTPTDLIFPFFLFIVGVAGVLSLEKRMAAGATRGGLARHAFTRGMAIVLVGWAMAAFPYTLEKLGRIRIPGVLPRIGVVFILGTWLVLLVSRRAGPLILAIAGLLALHTYLLLGTGYDLTREGNVQRAVDLAVLKGHLWKKDWDPEGIVSTLTALATMLTGTLAGLALQAPRPLERKISALAWAGVAGVSGGLLWGRYLPINKNLWTASYVALTSGFACLALAASLWAVDVRGIRRGLGLFLTFGKNPLLVFVLSGMLARVLGFVKVGDDSVQKVLYGGGFSWIGSPMLRSSAWAVATLAFWYVVMKGFERKGWYWKV